MIEYTWKIHSLIKQNLCGKEDVVVSVVWEKFGVAEDGHYGSFKAASNFDINALNSFIEYSNLKQDDVVSWILNYTADEYINEKINEDIESSRCHRVQVEDGQFPWS